MKIQQRNGCEYWYDRHYRCWFAAKVISSAGDLGPSINAFTKKEIIEMIDLGHAD